MSRKLPPLHLASADEGDSPLVSVCIPTFNRGDLTNAAIASALAQTYDRIELVVVDDASTDGSFDRIYSHDARVRIFRNEHRLGQALNRNRSLALARGELIKFLDSDDLLDSTCVQEMVDVFSADRRIGLVFSKRRVVHDQAPTSGARAWLEEYQDLHTAFAKLQPISDGRELLDEWLTAGFHGNWIGEPTAVMVRRSHLAVAGGFGFYVHQTVDSDLWARVLAYSLVGYIDRNLVTYRRGHPAESAANARTRAGWLDRLWSFESLASIPEIRLAYPQLQGLLEAERRQAWRTVAKMGFVTGEPRRFPMMPYLTYAGFRVLRRLPGNRPSLFAEMGADASLNDD